MRIIHPNPSDLNLNRTFILEPDHFPWAGYTPIVDGGTADAPLGVVGLLVGDSNELAEMNRLGALNPAVWIVSFGQLRYVI